MRRADVTPAMLGSLALHAGVIAILAVSWETRDLKVGSVVPVTIVANAPDTDVRPAVQAEQEAPALTEQPVPDAAPKSAPPAPEPTPQPPAPTPPAAKAAPPKPTPTPVPKAATPLAKAAPAKPAPKAAEKGLDLDALAASLSKAARPASARPSSAAKGPARPETATVARNTTGAGLSGLALSGLAEELQRRWNPNCEVEGGRDVAVRVSFTLGAGGQVVGDVTSQIRGAQTSVSQAAAERAVRAVYAASPFRTLPKEFYGDRIGVNFNAREACAT
ncbi:energy transducer TonB [Phenylobacterium sp.]|uniref:energy transducer TonB n=1 Tax=Phenylobacterium sp. TaxID=1871053 RepID=UPI003983411D